MFSSEQKFVVNGESLEDLTSTLTFGLKLADHRNLIPKAVDYDVENGRVVLYWHEVSGSEKVPPYLTVQTLSAQIMDFLNSGDVTSVYQQNHKPLNIDGGLDLGWVVRVPDYRSGIREHFYAVLVIEPDWIYYAK